MAWKLVDQIKFRMTSENPRQFNYRDESALLPWQSRKMDFNISSMDRIHQKNRLHFYYSSQPTTSKQSSDRSKPSFPYHIIRMKFFVNFLKKFYICEPRTSHITCYTIIANRLLKHFAKKRKLFLDVKKGLMYTRNNKCRY